VSRSRRSSGHLSMPPVTHVTAGLRRYKANLQTMAPQRTWPVTGPAHACAPEAAAELAGLLVLTLAWARHRFPGRLAAFRERAQVNGLSRLSTAGGQFGASAAIPFLLQRGDRHLPAAELP
jgi:hypothetical protein